MTGWGLEWKQRKIFVKESKTPFVFFNPMICYDVDQKRLYFHKDEMCAVSVAKNWLLSLLASYFAY